MTITTAQRFTDVLFQVQPTLEPDLIAMIGSRFESSMRFIGESPGMEDSRFEFYKTTGVFERHVYYDYGLKCIPNKNTTLKALMDLAFTIKVEMKLENRRFINC